MLGEIGKSEPTMTPARQREEALFVLALEKPAEKRTEEFRTVFGSRVRVLSLDDEIE